MIWLVPEISDLNLKLKDFSYNEFFYGHFIRQNDNTGKLYRNIQLN